MKKNIIKLTTAIMLLFVIVFSVSAEEAEPAILKKGPVPHLGIEFLGPNAIPSYYGEYQYQGGTVRIYFTREDILLSDDWIASDCGFSGVLIRGEAEQRIDAVYVDRKGWTAFFSFEAQMSDVCAFIDSYRKRQNYFLNIARDKTVFSFPAILDLKI